MNTYTKTCIVCPHCNAKTDSSIDHLKPGESFGPWHCDSCGGSFTGTANGSETQVVKGRWYFKKTYDLLVLEPQDKPVYFVIGGRNYDGDNGEHKRYFYEEHSCPINWLRDISMISFDADVDPHGVLSYMRSVEIPANLEPSAEDQFIISQFPEVVQ